MEIVYAAIWFNESSWWPWAGLGLALFLSLLSFISSEIVSSFLHETGALDSQTESRISELCRRANVRLLQTRKLHFAKNTRRANALVMGLGRRKTLVISDTLLNELNPDEVDAIVAHELGHIVHHHVAERLLVQSGLVVLSCWLLNRLLGAGPLPLPTGVGGLTDYAALPFLLMIATWMTAILQLFAFVLLRRQERVADKFGWELRNDSRAFITAMEKLAKLNLFEYSAGSQKVFDHPATKERMAAAEQFRLSRKQGVNVS